jgi:LemA protein
MKKSFLVLIGIFVFIGLIVLIGFLTSISTYNKMVQFEENVTSSWSQVENVYQRRADLIPNLVNTVKGYADFEKSTLTAVICKYIS